VLFLKLEYQSVSFLKLSAHHSCLVSFFISVHILLIPHFTKKSEVTSFKLGSNRLNKTLRTKINYYKINMIIHNDLCVHEQ
jgi:hypothetical protein